MKSKMTRCFKSAAAVLIAAALLASCAVQTPAGEERPEEKLTTVSFPLSAPVPEDNQEEFSEWIIPAKDMGEPQGNVWIEGKALSGGYFSVGGENYVPLEGTLESLGVAFEKEDGDIRFSFGGGEISVDHALGGLYRDKSLLGSVFRDRERGVMVPLSLFTEGGGYVFTAMENDLCFSKTVKSDEIPKGIKVPVLMYHAVSDDTWGIKELFVKPAEMEKQLKYLTEHGYTTVTFEDLPELETIKKPVMLTFDDGYRDNYEELFPLLEKYGCKATVFMIAGKEGKTHYLTADMIREMSDSGLVSIQSHTMTHPKLGETAEAKQREELEAAQKTILSWTHRLPFVLCYPSGSYNAATRTVGKEYYAFGIKMNGGTWNTSGDPFLVPRLYVSRETSLSAFAAMIG